MRRLDLIEKLETVSPALAANTTIEIMMHYWFTGERLAAYNDQIAMTVPLKTEFSGAVPKHLLSLLQATGFEEISLSSEAGALTLKVGKKLQSKLPMLPPASFNDVFQMPKSKVTELAEYDEFLDALETCAMSVSDDMTRPEYLGITVIKREKELHLYATNGATLSHARISNKGWPSLSKDVILPTAFCSQAIRLLKTKPAKVRVGVFDDHAMLVSGDTVLFGRLIDSSRNVNFPGVFERHFPSGNEKRLIDMPKGFANVLDRAIIIADAGGKPRTMFRVAGKNLDVFSKTDRGEVRDKLASIEQADVEITTNPKNIRSGVGTFKSILLTDRCIVMANAKEKQFYLISPVSEQ